MRTLPGFGLPIDEKNRALHTFGARLAPGKSFRELRQETSDTSGSNLYLERTAKDFYEPLGLAREFSPSGSISRHHNPVDAFRHAYTSGMTYGTFGILGEWAVEKASRTEKDDSRGLMDKYNNALGVQLYKEFEERNGRAPTEDEFADVVIEAILEDRLEIQVDNGPAGWRERISREYEGRRQERIDRAWQERRERAERTNRGDAYAPRELERYRQSEPNRGYDRIETRPGRGDRGRVVA